MAEALAPSISEIKLKRFLYGCTEKPHYLSGNPEFYSAFVSTKVRCIHDILKSSNPEKFFNIIEIVNSDGLLPRRDTLFFVMAVAAKSITTEPLKYRLFKTLSIVIKDMHDLYRYIKYSTLQQKKFSSGLNKVIGAYFNNKDPMELLKEITHTNGYFSWTHKDILKLSHFKWKEISTSVIAVYILFGIKKAQLVGENNSQVAEILTHLRKLDDLKRCEDELRIMQLIPEVQCPLDRVPSFYHRAQGIWEVLIPELPLRDLIVYMPRLHTYGLLKLPIIQTKIKERLSNIDAIHDSKIHPIEVCIGLKNFERGGKPPDPKFLRYVKKQLEENPDKVIKKPTQREAVKCPHLISALHKVMQISFENLLPCGRRIMITIDVTDKMMKPCMNNKNLSCLEAAAILALSILRVEKDVTVATFKDSDVRVLTVDKNATFNQMLSLLRDGTGNVTYCSPAAAFNWAAYRKKAIDMFINVLYYQHWVLLVPKELRDKEKPLDSLNAYRSQMILPHSKLATFSLNSHHLVIADGSPNVLDIQGFDKNIPIVLEAFGKGLF